jgi:hypothetical protein
MRLRSRFESPGRSQTSAKSTLSVNSASLGSKSPISFCAAGGSLVPPVASRCGLRIPVLFVAHLFHPFDGLPIEAFLNSDVSHTRPCRSSMPIFHARRNPDDVTLPNFLDWTAQLLNSARASRNDQSLTQRMTVPGCARPGLEVDAATRRVRGGISLKRGSMRAEPLKCSAGPVAEGCEPPRVILIVCEPCGDAVRGASEADGPPA